MNKPDSGPEVQEPAPIELPAPEVPASWRAAQTVPFRLSIAVPVTGMKLRDLRGLSAGMVFSTLISAAEDVPVRVGGAVMGWGELDNVDGRMAVRLTRLV